MIEDIHSLLARHFEGTATNEEVRAIQLWRAASPENEQDYTQLQKLWSNAGESATLLFDTDKAWHKVDGVIGKSYPPPKLVSLFSKKAIVAAAACIVLIASAWWLLYQPGSTNTVTAKLDAEKIALADGSIVYLRKGASLHFPTKFNDIIRNVSLTGEAFFEVMHNPEKKFVVTASATEVKVLGTSFSVNNQPGKVEVIVKTGKVQFNVKSDTSIKAMLTAGERAVFENNHIAQLRNSDPNFNAWQSGQLIFNNTPLQQVAQTIGKYYGITILLNEEERQVLEQARVTITFNQQSLASVLKELSLITTYSVKQINGNTYKISTD
jgi:transmembrane sensor